MPFDSEIWCPCRLGDPFQLYDLGHESTAWLRTIRADWMGGRGDFTAVSWKPDLMKESPYRERLGIGPRPWSCCWTCEAKIRITPPPEIWSWDGIDAKLLGLDLPPMRNGRPRRASLIWVGIRYGVPGYCVSIEGRGRIWLDKIILFIRHTRRPERSWFTLNVDVRNKTILQNHGYGNESAHGRKLHIPKAVQDFVDLWKQEVLDKWTLPKPKKGGSPCTHTSAA